MFSGCAKQIHFQKCPIVVLNHFTPVTHQSLSEHASRCMHFLHQSKTLAGTYSCLSLVSKGRMHVCCPEASCEMNAPARSLVTEQSGLPVIPKHVPHPQSVHRQSQVKPTSPPSLKSHFGDGWTKSLCFLSHFPTSASAQTSVYGQAVLFTFLSFPDGCPSCSGMLRATNKIFIQCCWHQMKVLSKLFARIYCLFILVPLWFFKVYKAYLSH